MALNWYSHHIGDYAKKTAHLTILEHGVYRLLLDYFYSQGGPFKDDRNKIYRSIRANNGSERRAVDRVLSEFFELSADGLWNQTRASQEILRYNEIKEIRKKVGAIGGAKAVANRVAKQYPPTPTPTERDKNLSQAMAADAEEFYKNYPRHDGKKAGIKAYLVARKRGVDHAAIMEGVARYSNLTAGKEKQFIALPASWVNGDRWTDEYANPSPMAEPTVFVLPDGIVKALKNHPKFTGAVIKRWFDNCRFDIGARTIVAPTAFAADWITTNYVGALTAVFGDGMKIVSAGGG